MALKSLRSSPNGSGAITTKTRDRPGTDPGPSLSYWTMDVRKGPKQADAHATSAFSFFHVSTDVIQKAVLEFGEDVVVNGLESSMDCRRDLLLRRPPRPSGGVPFAPTVNEDAQDFATRIAPLLDRTVLPIQGPPGTGKSYTGARMICALVKEGRKVGVMATSHKVIRNLLKGVVKDAARHGQRVRVAHKVGDSMADGTDIVEIDDTREALAALAGGLCDVLGGVAWTWAHDNAADLVDVLQGGRARGQLALEQMARRNRGNRGRERRGSPIDAARRVRIRQERLFRLALERANQQRGKVAARINRLRRAMRRLRALRRRCGCTCQGGNRAQSSVRRRRNSP